MPFCKARLKAVRFVAARAGYACGLTVLLLLFGSRALQNAVAEGDTRTISLHHIHTDEDITITFKRDGRYDDAALEKLNWFLRDWRKGEQTKMDPHLIDLVWEVQREAGNKAPIWVVCGYRSPATNAMLRHRSAGVARFSQHMLGRAMDFYIPGVPLEDMRAMGLRLARGGVGFYPTSGSPFVHMDTGSVRMWPRMSREQLVRVFPDGKTVQIPTDGKPLQGYALALAEIQAARQQSFGKFGRRGAQFRRRRRHHGGERGPSQRQSVCQAPWPEEGRGRRRCRLVRPRRGAGSRRDHPHQSQSGRRCRRRTGESGRDPRGGADQAHSHQFICGRGRHAGRAEIGAAAPDRRPFCVALAKSSHLRARLLAGPAGQRRRTALRRRARVALKWQAPIPTPPVPSARCRARPTTVSRRNSRSPMPNSPARRPTPLRSAARAAVDKAGAVIGESETTVAVKGVNDQPKTSVQKAIQLAVAAVKVSERLDNPWLRAIILSPSVHRFLSTLAFGARDVTYLASLMVKPASSVMMTFSSDPNRGLSQDHFSGSAIVFLSTITYPTRTASLQ